MAASIRAWAAPDRPAILALNAQLQEHERALRPSRRPGSVMTEEYVSALETRLAEKGEDGALLVAESGGGEVVGFATCFIDEDELEQNPRHLRIEDLAVAREFRRQGICRALVDASIAFAHERGVDRVELSVLTVNSDAAATYAALGFRPILVTLERMLPQAEPSAS